MEQTVEVSEWAKERIRLLRRAWDVPEADVVDRVLTAFLEGQTQDGRPVPEPDQDWTRVHASYGQAWIEGRFDPESGRLAITSGELAGRRFKSPSGAARAVVRFHNPDIRPNRNGWVFWTVTDSGQPLESLRRRRALPE
jgi:hypothetical protein